MTALLEQLNSDVNRLLVMADDIIETNPCDLSAAESILKCQRQYSAKLKFGPASLSLSRPPRGLVNEIDDLGLRHRRNKAGALSSSSIFIYVKAGEGAHNRRI
ncbi:hypothetical protein [Caulobacter radicis]|uniref:hypothetical protein n=1 Tax=Caulobacter radicis TaxID=2172650 RepID=UPI001057B08E|nr:hypothetical protein [Caulobacter radicis]